METIGDKRRRTETKGDDPGIVLIYPILYCTQVQQYFYKHPISDIYHCESHTKVVGGRYLGDLSYAMFYGELPGRKQCPKLLLLEFALRAYTGHNQLLELNYNFTSCDTIRAPHHALGRSVGRYGVNKYFNQEVFPIAI